MDNLFRGEEIVGYDYFVSPIKGRWSERESPLSSIGVANCSKLHQLGPLSGRQTRQVNLSSSLTPTKSRQVPLILTLYAKWQITLV